MLERTSSGGFGGNDGFLYLTLPALPLGGVGKILATSTNPAPTPESPLLYLDLGPGPYGFTFPIC